MPLLKWEETLGLLEPGRGSIPEEVTPDPKKDYSALDIMNAALQKENIVTAGYEYLTNRPPKLQAQKGYNPFRDSPDLIVGNERHAVRLAGAGSPEEVELRLQRIRKEEQGEEILRQSGGWGTAALVAAGLISPETLVSMALPVAAPVAWGSRAARIGMGVGAGAALDIGAEAILHETQETRTLTESALRVGAGAILTGIMGGVASRVPKDEFEKLAKQLQGDLKTEGSTVGAASADFLTTLEEEGIARGGKTLARTIGRVSPTTRVLQAPVKAARQLVQRLVEVPYWLEKNLKGVPTSDNVETAIKRGVNQRRISIANTFDAAFAEHGQRAGAEALPRREFGEAVSMALQSGDRHAIPEVQKMAQKVRELFEADKKMLQELGVLPEDFHILGAKSYFPRVYDGEAIVLDRIGFEKAIRDWFTNNPKPVADDGAEEGVTAFHGTKANFDEFDESFTEHAGFHFSESEDTARVFADDQGTPGRVVKSRLRLSKVLELTDAEQSHPLASAKAIDGKGLTGRKPEGENFGELEQTVWNAGLGKEAGSAEATRAQSAALRGWLRANGYDAVKYTNEFEGARIPSYLVVNPKSITPAEPTPVYREPAEIDAAVKETVDRILGTVRGVADVGHGGSVNPSPLKTRTLDVPDEVLRPWLVSDFERVMQGYVRAMQPQIEMRKAFGSITLENEIKQIQEQSHVLINKAETNAAKEKIRKKTAAAIDDLVLLRDRLLNHDGPRMNHAAWLVKATKFARSYNYVRLLGSQTLSSLSDYGHVISRFGLARTGKMTAKFLTSLKANRLIRSDAKRLGTAIDWAIDTRGQTLADIGDELSGSKLERRMQWATQKFTRVSGMATWNSSIKAITAALEQDAILRSVGKWDKLSTIKRAKLAQNGIGKAELDKIAAQAARYGENVDGLRRARTDLWVDRAAAKLFEDAVVKVADMMVITRSAGDIPGIMNNEIVKTLMQFKSFGIAATNRITIPLAQQLARGDLAAANGLAAMLTMGAMTYYMKELAAGREPDLSADRVIAEGLNWSGALAYMPDVYDPLASMVHGPRLSRYSDTSPLAFALGPSFGTATDIATTIPEITDLGLTQADIHKVRKLLPFQNLFYLRRIINALEGEAGEAVGAEGADSKTFGQRVTELEQVAK